MVKIYSKNEINELIHILKNEGVISVPTDTVYGICGIINSKKAHDKIVEIKHRPQSKSFPVMCANEKQIKDIAIVNEKAEKIIRKFMPGPITIVLRKKENLPDYITNGKETIAVRMATSKELKKIIEKVGCPLFMTSANQSGQETCKSIEEIAEKCPLIDGILKGPISFGIGSTIIDCTGDDIKILREGPILLEQIRRKIKIKMDVENLKNEIEKFEPYNEQEEVDKRIMLKYINDFDDVLTRENEYGHFTSSAFVLNKERTKILMIYHKIYNSWAWPGGHSDGDNNLLYVAMKEVKEETGIKNVKPINQNIYSLELINVNGHEKRGKYVGSHVHLNVTYLLEADENEKLYIKEDENKGVKWVPIDEILKESTEEWIKQRVYSKIIEKMKKDKVVK